jgi:hypothetical protein
VTFLVVALSVALAAAVGQQEPAGRGRGRGSPPQPQQKQGVEYLTGRWSFSWTGRESPVTAGPRKGTTVFAIGTTGSTLEIKTEGTVEDTSTAFTESGTASWDAANRTLTFKETLANGTTLTGTGDWSSPLAIRYESQPAQVGGQSVRIRRTYSILSAQSFSVAEEISIGGGPFQRLGNGLFQKN